MTGSDGGAPDSSTPPTGPAEQGEPVYLPPVDPWATAEAQAVAGSVGQVTVPVPPPQRAGAIGITGEPVIASTVPEGRGRPAYRRPALWVGAAAVATVLVVGVVLLVRWPGSYPALDYRPLADIRRVSTTVAVSSGFADVHVAGDRAYLAAAERGPLQIVAVATDTGKQIWSSVAAGTAQRWEWLTGVPGAVVALTDTESGSENRRIVVLSGDTGAKLWERSIGRDDSILLVGDTVVVAERSQGQVIGLGLRGGESRWRHANPSGAGGGTATAVIGTTTPADLSGAVRSGEFTFTPEHHEDKRIIQIGADRSARVIDASTGEITARQSNMANPDDLLLAHNGRLIVGSTENGYRISSHDLAALGEPRVVFTAPDSTLRPRQLTSCGPDRACLIDTVQYDTETATIVSVDLARTGQLWRRAVPGAESLVPVGESVLVSVGSSPAKVTLISAEGAEAWTRPGAAGRIDNGNVLLFAKAPSTYAEDVSLAGEHLGDELVQLGPLTGVRAATCSWNAVTIACAADKDFVLRRFAD